MENGGGCGGDVASLLLLTKIFTPYVGTTMGTNGYSFYSFNMFFFFVYLNKG